MVSSDAATPAAYLAALPADRRATVEAVRTVVLEHLPEGFEETVAYGMLTYVLPLERFAETYNGQPLAVLSVANQKNHVAVYLMGVYGDAGERDWFIGAWRATGKKLDMGKSCVRFKTIDDAALDVIGEAVARVRPEDLIAAHHAAHGA